MSLKSEESALTGESVPSEKDADAAVEENAPLGDRVNMVFSGCSITYGTATAVVTGTGMDTEMGKITQTCSKARAIHRRRCKKARESGQISRYRRARSVRCYFCRRID